LRLGDRLAHRWGDALPVGEILGPLLRLAAGPAVGDHQGQRLCGAGHRGEHHLVGMCGRGVAPAGGQIVHAGADRFLGCSVGNRVRGRREDAEDAALFRAERSTPEQAVAHLLLEPSGADARDELLDGHGAARPFDLLDEWLEEWIVSLSVQGRVRGPRPNTAGRDVPPSCTGCR
jgi:hypothetical protein